MTPEPWIVTTGMGALVQGWVTTPTSNLGMKLSVASNLNLILASSEYDLAQYHPILEVTYTTGGTVPLGDLQIQIVGTRLNVTGSNVPSPASTYNPQNHNVLGEAFLPFDNVRLTVEPIPEPAAALLAAGALLFSFRRPRRTVG